MILTLFIFVCALRKAAYNRFTLKKVCLPPLDVEIRNRVSVGENIVLPEQALLGVTWSPIQPRRRSEKPTRLPLHERPLHPYAS